MPNTKEKFICIKCGDEFESEDYFISYANFHEVKCPKCGEETYQ
jgi:DNA-directed RNA polymerase subunit RPC12/RpoP